MTTNPPHEAKCKVTLRQAADILDVSVLTIRRRADRRDMNGFPEPIDKDSYREYYCISQLSDWTERYLSTRLNLKR